MDLTLVLERDVSRGLYKKIKEGLCLCFPNEKDGSRPPDSVTRFP